MEPVWFSCNIDSTVEKQRIVIYLSQILHLLRRQARKTWYPNVVYELSVAKSNLTDESILMLYTGNIEAAMPFWYQSP